MTLNLIHFIKRGRIEVQTLKDQLVVMRTIVYADGDVHAEYSNSADPKIITQHQAAVSEQLTKVLFSINALRMSFFLVPWLTTLAYLFAILQIDMQLIEQLISMLLSLVIFAMMKYGVSKVCRRWITSKFI